MRISDIGEFGLISRISELIDQKSDRKASSRNNLLVGVGDDAAAWKSSPGIELMTTDVLIEGIHFNFSYTGWRDLGWKSIVINISDINSMGGRPQFALVSLSLPGNSRVNDVLEMYEGMLSICNQYGISIAGGNLSASGKVVLNITLTGVADSGIMTRDSAIPGYRIAVFGYPGLSAAGLKVLKRHRNMDPEARQLLASAHLHPHPVLTAGPVLAAHGVKTAIDTSDGLVADLTHICEASHLSAAVHVNDLPVHALLTTYFSKDSLYLMLAGGEDYELLFAADAATMNNVLDLFDPQPHVIGEITEGRPGSVALLDGSGSPVHIERGGWDHFKSRYKK